MKTLTASQIEKIEWVLIGNVSHEREKGTRESHAEAKELLAAFRKAAGIE